MEEFNREEFIEQQKTAIQDTVGDKCVLSFLSGGVDSAVATVLAHQALGEQLTTIFVDTGLMRKNEPQQVKDIFESMGIPVIILDAREKFLTALEGKVLPGEKREAITDVFYRQILAEQLIDKNVAFLFQGTNLADVNSTQEDSVAPQHNVRLEQITIPLGVMLIEPLKELFKPQVRQVARELKLPAVICERIPFPGPGLSVRIVGEVTQEKLDIIRRVTAIVESSFARVGGVFQYGATLMDGLTPSADRQKLGYIVVIWCKVSTDATTAEPKKIDNKADYLRAPAPMPINFLLTENMLYGLRDAIYKKVPEVLRVAWDISTKPPGSMEFV